ncbi:MAG: ankyrin repeat domain-containing protein [Planctomycetes bacterium]|nr:ankyrin repeat domain-containing protein [Planctomycetota bacterium]
MGSKPLFVFLLIALSYTLPGCGGKAGKLRKAAKVGDVERVKQLLDAGADINATDMFSQTALHLAALHGHKDVVQLLIDRGANVNPTDESGATPLNYARSKGHKDIAMLLGKHGGMSGKQVRAAEEK